MSIKNDLKINKNTSLNNKYKNEYQKGIRSVRSNQSISPVSSSQKISMGDSAKKENNKNVNNVIFEQSQASNEHEN